MSLDIYELRQKKVLLVGGKGGVGKTTIAASIAVKAAQQQNKRVLLVSTDPAHSLSDIFGRQIGSAPVHLCENLYVLELDPEKEVDAYLDRVLMQVHECQRHVSVWGSAPGAQEAALLERLAQLLSSGLEEYDLLIFDTAPTGHTLRLLSLPEVMAAWSDGLLKHNQRSEQLGKVLSHLSPGKDINNIFKDPDAAKFGGMDQRGQELLRTLESRQRLFHQARRILHDASLTSFIFVLTAERLPVLETARALQSLRDIEVDVAGLIINRILPEQLEGEFWHSHLQRQRDYLIQIDSLLGHLPQKHLALQKQEIQGVPALLRFAQSIYA